MHKKIDLSLLSIRSMSIWVVICLFTLTSCMSPPVTTSKAPLRSQTTDGGFRTQSTQVTEPPLPQLDVVSTTPENPAYELTFKSGAATPNTIRMPDQGSFKVSVEVGSDYSILDGDATDGMAKIQVPAHVFDIYVQPEQDAQPTMCQANTASTAPILDQMDQLVLDKANSLISQGKGQCTYIAPNNQRQNANCNTTSSGISCSGPINKTISSASCPEIAIYAGAMNLNNAQPGSRLFVATSNNLTLNQSAKGVLATRGNINTSLNNASLLEGIFVGASSNNLNIGGTSQVKGLYTLANNSSLSANLNNSASFEGVLCATGNVNFNRNGRPVVYNPNVLGSWLSDVPNLPNLLCPARPNFYTQMIPLNCSSSSSPATMAISDPLYLLNQTVSPVTNGSWYKMAGRSLPVPADWYSSDGDKYVLTLDNQRMNTLRMRFYSQNTDVVIPSSVRVIPQIDCIEQNRLGTYTAYLSYHNQMSGSVKLPVGSSNRFQPGPENTNQITEFYSGKSASYPHSPHSVTFSENILSWTLGAFTLTAQATDPTLKCQQDIIQIPSHTPVRKVFLDSTNLNFSGGEDQKNIGVAIDDVVDLKRRILLTMKNGINGAPANEIEIRFNGQKLMPWASTQVLVKPNSPELTVEVSGLLHKGNNVIEVIARGGSSSHAQIRLDGFMLPVDIPGAFHSAINHDKSMRLQPVQKGIVGVKFLEGMKVRLQGHDLQGLKDNSAISLAMLNSALGQKIIRVAPTVPGSPEEHDSAENAVEALRNMDVPNQNLFYLLTFPENEDVWKIVDQLKVLPFVEEAFPKFLPQPASSSSASPYPNEVLLTTDLGKPDNKLWLENTHIMTRYPSSSPSPSAMPTPGASPSIQWGAWELTRGKNVTIANFDFGFRHATLGYPTHPDLLNVEYIQNVYVNPGYTDLGHGTPSTGIIGATGNNGIGSAGVAHEGKTLSIHYANNEQGTPGKCYSGISPCDIGIDSVLLALDKGARVLNFETDAGGDETPGTLEHSGPDFRSFMMYQIWDPGVKAKYGFNPVFVIPAGNRACEGLGSPADAARKTTCLAKFPNGKDIREEEFTRTKYVLVQGINPSDGIPYISADTSTDEQYVLPTLDTGTIIVGALDISGEKMIPDPNWPPMNHGKSENGVEGHGTDISAPGHKIYTTTFNINNLSELYGNFGGTSGATPIISGVVGLMLSQKPELTPIQVRSYLRKAQQTLLSGEDISGMVDALDAVCEASGYENVSTCLSSFHINGSGDFNISAHQPVDASPEINLWLLRGTQKLRVNPLDVVAVAINDQDLTQLEIEIINPDGSSPIRANVRDIANNYATFEVPASINEGLKNVLIKIGAHRLQLENALDVQEPSPMSISWDKRSIFTNGNDWSNITIKVRKPDGSKYEDGSAFFVTFPVHQGGPAIVAYEDGSPAQYATWSKNSEIKLRVASTSKIHPSAYPEGSNWPSPGHPAILPPNVCIAGYWNGYYCAEQIFANTEQPSLYLKDTFRFDLQPENQTVYSGGGNVSYKVLLYDRAGLPVPDGTPIYLSYTRGTMGVWNTPGGYMLSDQNELNFTYTPANNGHCWGEGYGEAMHFRLGYWDTDYLSYVSVIYGLGSGCN